MLGEATRATRDLLFDPPRASATPALSARTEWDRRTEQTNQCGILQNCR